MVITSLNLGFVWHSIEIGSNVVGLFAGLPGGSGSKVWQISQKGLLHVFREDSGSSSKDWTEVVGDKCPLLLEAVTARSGMIP